jgi:Putative MetA-pathway of phenol degradation
MNRKKLLSVFALGGASIGMMAQSPVGGFMQGKGNGNVVVSYSAEKYSKVYLVPNQVDGVPVFNEVETTSTSVYATYGISNVLDVVFSLPYISSTGNASDAVLNNLGFENKRSGLQDATVFLKYNPFYLKLGQSRLRLMAALGVKTPVGGYKVDEGLQSIIAIGNRATTVSPIAIAHYTLEGGFFTTAQAGYNISTGTVPSSYLTEVKFGYAASKVYIDAFLSVQKSTSGVDILGNGFTGVFPETKVNATKLGFNLYVPFSKQFGISAGLSSAIGGRNLGKSTGVYGAIIYKFNRSKR